MLLHELANMQILEVPRCYMKMFEKAEVELHLFADASQESFAVVAYWRAGINGKMYLQRKVKCDEPLKGEHSD